jgi:hypothetical protein
MPSAIDWWKAVNREAVAMIHRLGYLRASWVDAFSRKTKVIQNNIV